MILPESSMSEESMRGWGQNPASHIHFAKSISQGCPSTIIARCNICPLQTCAPQTSTGVSLQRLRNKIDRHMVGRGAFLHDVLIAWIIVLWCRKPSSTFSLYQTSVESKTDRERRLPAIFRRQIYFEGDCIVSVTLRACGTRVGNSGSLASIHGVHLATEGRCLDVPAVSAKKFSHTTLQEHRFQEI